MTYLTRLEIAFILHHIDFTWKTHEIKNNCAQRRPGNSPLKPILVVSRRRNYEGRPGRSQLRITRRAKQWQPMWIKATTVNWREKQCWPMMVDPSWGHSARKTMTANKDHQRQQPTGDLLRWITMKFNQFVVINLPLILMADRRLGLEIDQHNVSLLFWPVLYLFENLPLIAGPNRNAFVGRVISRHVTMLVNEQRNSIGRQANFWGSLGAQNNDSQWGSNTVNWQANSLGPPGANKNAGQWWSIPIEDHSARKTMTANEVQTQLVGRRFTEVHLAWIPYSPGANTNAGQW